MFVGRENTLIFSVKLRHVGLVPFFIKRTWVMFVWPIFIRDYIVCYRLEQEVSDPDPVPRLVWFGVIHCFIPYPIIVDALADFVLFFCFQAYCFVWVSNGACVESRRWSLDFVLDCRVVPRGGSALSLVLCPRPFRRVRESHLSNWAFGHIWLVRTRRSAGVLEHAAGRSFLFSLRGSCDSRRRCTRSGVKAEYRARYNTRKDPYGLGPDSVWQTGCEHTILCLHIAHTHTFTFVGHVLHIAMTYVCVKILMRTCVKLLAVYGDRVWPKPNTLMYVAARLCVCIRLRKIQLTRRSLLSLWFE